MVTLREKYLDILNGKQNTLPPRNICIVQSLQMQGGWFELEKVGGTGTAGYIMLRIYKITIGFIFDLSSCIKCGP